MDSAVLRILDANANRAREALRVLEEHARFALNHAALAERIKSARHELAAALAQWPARDLLAARDVAGDVGTQISTPAESTRGSTRDVAIAAARRAAEALRCLEEFGKTLSPIAAARLERLRYDAYELEQAVLLDGPGAQRIRTARLHVLITEAGCRRAWPDAVAAAIDGGADVLQLREKALPDAELLRRAEALCRLAGPRGAAVVINDRPDIARLVGADGAHVGQDDLPVAAARRIAGGGIVIGKSTHTREQAAAAIDEAPDYVAVGPMFESQTKRGSAIAGPAFAAGVIGRTRLPVVAIGGVSAARIGELRDAGVRCVAVCQAVIGADDPARAAAELIEALGGSRPPPATVPA